MNTIQQIAFDNEVDSLKKSDFNTLREEWKEHSNHVKYHSARIEVIEEAIAQKEIESADDIQKLYDDVESLLERRTCPVLDPRTYEILASAVIEAGYRKLEDRK